MSPPRNARIACASFTFRCIDIGEAYRSLRLLHPIMSNSPLSDDSSTDEETRQENQALYPLLRTTPEERDYHTIPGSAQATIACLTHRTAQANPLVQRCSQDRRLQRHFSPVSFSTTRSTSQQVSNQTQNQPIQRQWLVRNHEHYSIQGNQQSSQRLQHIQVATPPNRITSTICSIS